jgi:hypothetical protein
MEHVNKHQTAQDTEKNIFTRYGSKTKQRFTALNQIITQGTIHNGTISCIRLILMTSEIFQSSSYKIYT